jgi:putative flippase GtrA
VTSIRNVRAIARIRLERLVRFGLVGVTSNLVLFAAFAMQVKAGVEPFIATIVTYALGVTGTYCFNRSWAFASLRQHRSAAVLYVGVHLLGAITQVSLQWAFHYQLQFNPLLVQAIATIVVAMLIFALLDVVVFPQTRRKVPQANVECGTRLHTG